MKSIRKTGMAIALATTCSVASAGTANFEGLSVYLGASAVTTSIKLEADSFAANGLGKSSYSADIGADYGLKLTDSAVLLLGGTYGLNKLSAFEVSGATDLAGELKLKDRFSLYAAPGVTLGNSALLYAKLAYVSATADGEGGKTHAGYGYGAGARVSLSKEVFLNIEFMQNNYGDKTYFAGTIDETRISAKSTAGTVALGYRF